MTIRKLAALVATTGLLAAACSSNASDEAAVVETTSPATITEAPTTAPPTTAAPTTTETLGRGGPAPIEHGVGDALYPAAGAEGIDVIHYDLALDTTGDDLTGVATIEVSITDPDLADLSFDFVGPTVTAVRVNGADAAFVQTPIEVNISHDGSNDAEVIIEYEGLPEPLEAGIGLGLVGWSNKPWGSFVVSEPTGAPTWFPANDHPTDKATFSMSVIVDDGETAVGPGPLQESVGNTFTFAPEDQMAPYLMSLVIGEFDVVEATGASGVPVKTTTHPDVPPYEVDLDSMILDLEELFGPYPLDSYGYVVVPERLGFALENQTLSLFDLQTYNNDQIHVHELAHQWFGDYLSPANWNDIWLNEGFATWVDTWWTANGDASAFDRLALEVPPSFLGPLQPTETNELFSTTVYVRGGLTLEALRRTIGHDEFQVLLQEWLSRYGGGSASTADFISLVDQLHGVDAAALVTEWVEAPAPPALPEL